ncbi:ATP-binding protein [Candidatus Pelagibacter sp.]|nr:ATP-binding protein [Candidatus Pelagibacter sp.]
MQKDKVNIAPSVGYLSILSSINYKAWFAIGEFVDNSIQSYIDNKSNLKSLHGRNYKLKISIYISKSKIEIRDNAAGIGEKDYYRAFRAAARPEKKSGLSEYGMGMKTAACWFSPIWKVKSKALNEKEIKTVKFNIADIVKDEINELEITKEPAQSKEHFTEITLSKLNKVPAGSTISRIKQHISSMYRHFIENNEIEIKVNEEKLIYKLPEIMNAPLFVKPHEIIDKKKIKWIKKIQFKYGDNKNANGYAAIYNTASTKDAGFALFRRNRLIQGVGENEGYRPLEIFEAPNAFVFQRVFGEIHLNDEEATHTKDGFQWSREEEEDFINKLKTSLEKEPTNLIKQANNFRKDRRTRELKKQTEEGLNSSIKLMPSALAILEDVKIPRQSDIPTSLQSPKESEIRKKSIKYGGYTWDLQIILNYDKAETQWLQISEKGKKSKQVQIQIAMSMGFTQQYFGDRPDEIEGMINLVSYLALAEVVARDRGEKSAHTIRLSINEIIRTLPPELGY